MYSFGIGAHVDRDLVTEIARRGNGACDFVDSYTNMSMEKKVLDMLDIAMKVNIIKPTCAHARWALMRHLLSVRLWLENNSLDKKSVGKNQYIYNRLP